MTVTIDLGPGRVAMPAAFPSAAGDLAGQLAGYRITHFRPGTTELCEPEGSWIPVGEDGWTLVSEDPLTLAPSLRCTVCGDHGFVRGGTWVPA